MKVEYSGEDESTYFYKLVPDGDRIQTVIIGLNWLDWQTKWWKGGSMSERITLQRVRTENLLLDAEDLMRDWGSGTPEIASYEVDGDTLNVEFEPIEINITDIFDECESSIEEVITTYDTV